MIIIKTQKEIEVMRQGGKLLAEIMEKLGQEVMPGKSTEDLEKLAEELVFLAGGEPAFKGFSSGSRIYPNVICASLNDEIVHGVPSAEIILKEGDIVKIDIGMKYRGMITDMARTFAVGKISKRASKIMEATKRSLDIGISKIKSGKKLKEYSRAVEKFAKKEGFLPVRDLVGHGVGKTLHEDPIVPNSVLENSQEGKVVLEKGMTLALEPMLSEGTDEIMEDKNGWTWKTADGKLSAHFEDTIVVTEDGCEILTRI